MNEMVLVLSFFVLVTFSHALFLLKAKKSLWKIHFILNSVLWTVLLALIVILQFRKADVLFSGELRWLGILLLVAGLYLCYRVARVLNLKELMGIRFFYPIESRKISYGIFKYLNNPMYDGFILIFLGLGFSLGISADFYLAVASFVFLNVFLANVENYKMSWIPF